MRDSPLPESLSAFYAVVPAHAKPACALTAATRHHEARLQAPSRPPFQPEQESAQPGSSHPAHPIPKRPSGTDGNPIGRSPRSSQTPATYFKRPYRNCPGKRSSVRPPLSRRGSPDRDLTFMRTDPCGNWFNHLEVIGERAFSRMSPFDSYEHLIQVLKEDLRSRFASVSLLKH